MKQFLLAIFVLTVLITPAIATDYVAKFTVDKVETVSGSNAWASAQTFSLNKSESKDYLGMVTIIFSDIDTNSNQIVIKTTGTATTGFTISTGETKNIKGSYNDNASLASINDIRIKLISLTPYTTVTINSTSDSPIYAYLYTDREWSLRKDDSVTFDARAQKASSDSGITYSGNTALKEVYVYFKRLQSVPVSITVSSKDEPPSIWDSEKLKYTITKSDTYVFTVKYDQINPWGASTETINKYTLVVSGLESSSVSKAIYPTAPYDIFVGDTKVLPMTEAGTFSTVTGATITPVNNNTYNIRFDSAGTYNLIYNTANGQTTAVNFNVIQKSNTKTSDTSPQTAATVSGNQAQNTGEGGSSVGMLGIDNKYLGLGLIVLVGILIYNKKYRGGSGGGSSRYEPKKNFG